MSPTAARLLARMKYIIEEGFDGVGIISPEDRSAGDYSEAWKWAGHYTLVICHRNGRTVFDSHYFEIEPEDFKLVNREFLAWLKEWRARQNRNK